MKQYITHYQLIIVVTVYILPKITQQPTSTSGNLYSTVNLTCRATGNPIPTILWYKDNVLIPNDNNDPSVLMFSELNLKDRGFYHCEARSVIRGNITSVNSSRVILNITGIYHRYIIIDICALLYSIFNIDVVQYTAEMHISEEATNKTLSEVIQGFINQVLSIINMKNIAYFLLGRLTVYFLVVAYQTLQVHFYLYNLQITSSEHIVIYM